MAWLELIYWWCCIQNTTWKKWPFNGNFFLATKRKKKRRQNWQNINFPALSNFLPLFDWIYWCHYCFLSKSGINTEKKEELKLFIVFSKNRQFDFFRFQLVFFSFSFSILLRLFAAAAAKHLCNNSIVFLKQCCVASCKCSLFYFKFIFFFCFLQVQQQQWRNYAECLLPHNERSAIFM